MGRARSSAIQRKLPGRNKTWGETLPSQGFPAVWAGPKTSIEEDRFKTAVLWLGEGLYLGRPERALSRGGSGLQGNSWCQEWGGIRKGRDRCGWLQKILTTARQWSFRKHSWTSGVWGSRANGGRGPTTPQRKLFWGPKREKSGSWPWAYESGEENGERGGRELENRERSGRQEREEEVISHFYNESGMPNCCQVTLGLSLDKMLTERDSKNR